MSDWLKVKVIKIKGQAALIEWEEDGAPKRGTLPSELMMGDEVHREDLSMVAPYGIPWGAMLGAIEVTPDQIEDALHREGIWSGEDLLANVGKARDAIQSAIGADLGNLIRIAKSSK